MMNAEEFDKRCHQVFIEPDGVETTYCSLDFDGESICVHCVEIKRTKSGKIKDAVSVDDEPDMTERPHAMEYLLGWRNSFDD